MRNVKIATAIFVLIIMTGAWGHADPLKTERDEQGSRPSFHELNPAHSSARFHAYVSRALEFLRNHPTQIGRLTYRSIEDGYVLIDEFCDLTCWDFCRIRRDLLRYDVELPEEDYANLSGPRSLVVERIEAVFDAYSWGNRIYISYGLTVRELATTLVHEVNHVINRTDEDYYERWPVTAFLHEYRAFYAEKLLNPAAYEGVDLLEHVIDLYEYDREDIPKSILENPLTGIVLPTETEWTLRDVESDPVDDDRLCPINRPKAIDVLSRPSP